MRVVPLIACCFGLQVPAAVQAQPSFIENETLVFSLSATGYVQENAQAGQTSLGAGIGALLGHGVTRWFLPLIAVDIGVINNDAYLARTIGHADLALRLLLPAPALQIKPFAHIAFSSQLIERPASADDLLRTGFTAGLGFELPRNATRSFEIGVRRTWLKDEEELIQVVDKDVYRIHLGLTWRPPR
jgi:hypothetical protein